MKLIEKILITVSFFSLLILLACNKDEELLGSQTAVAPQIVEAQPGGLELYAPNGRPGLRRSMTLRLPGMEEPVKTGVEVIDGMVILEGDIVLGTEAEVSAPELRAITIDGYRWPGGVIPFVIESGHPREAEIRDAITHVNMQTRLHLVARSSEADYVEFRTGDGCSSSVGRRGGRQMITVSTACAFGNIVHEICHAAGLFHEQSRCDRNTYVDIHEENIDPAMIGNFNRICIGATDVGSYNYGSIMHYPSRAFSINGQPTITVRTPPGTATTTIGQRTALSSGDVSAINRLYPDETPQRAWVWANQPSVSTYTPSSSYQFSNGLADPITIRRSSPGNYQVTIPGAGADFGGIAHTVAYGGNHSAQIESWYPFAGNLIINVNVFGAAGSAQDGRFVLFFYRETRASGRLNSAYQWANSTSSLSTLYSFNSKGEGNTLTRTGVGRYRVVFNGIVPNVGTPGSHGNVLVTPYGNAARRASVVNWGHSGDNVTATIQLNNMSGEPADGMFTVSYISDFGIGQGNSPERPDQGAYVWANNPSAAAAYTPSSFYQNINTGAGAVTIDRVGTGYYRVTLPNIKSFNSTMAMASAYGPSNNYVSVERWTGNAAGGTDVFIRSYNASGSAADTYFTLFYYTNENTL